MSKSIAQRFASLCMLQGFCDAVRELSPDSFDFAGSVMHTEIPFVPAGCRLMIQVKLITWRIEGV